MSRTHSSRSPDRERSEYAPPHVNRVVANSGRSLDSAERRHFERSLGYSFADVRIHDDPDAAASADSLGARAYTVGQHVVVGNSAPDPHTARGRDLMAHELTHTIQQRDVVTPSGPIKIGGRHDAAESEARSRASGSGRRGGRTTSDSGAVLRGDLLGSAAEAVTQPFENLSNVIDTAAMPLAAVFDQVVNTNIAVASGISIPGNWREIIAEYAQHDPVDGLVLIRGLVRFPSFWRGGWIMDLQPGAAAMTLDDDIFVSDNLSLKTYAHELVHVAQYSTVGKIAFLASYFGSSGATILYRMARGQPLNPMRSSPHEEQAYNIGNRFAAWYATTKGGNASSVVV